MSVEQRKLAKRIAALEAQAAAQARASQGRNRTIVNGALRFVDDTGQVRQVVGLQTDGTITTVDRNGPTPPTPSAPIVTPTAGGLRIRFDGATAAGDAWPSDVAAVRVHVSQTLGAPATSSTQVATFPGAAANTLVLALGEGAWHVKLVAVSTSGKVSLPSDEVTGIPGPFLSAYNETFTVSNIAGDHQTLFLARTPLENSEHLYWNGVYQLASEWSRVGRVITVPDPMRVLQVGDTITVEYLQQADSEPLVVGAYPDAVLALAPSWYYRFEPDNPTLDSTGHDYNIQPSQFGGTATDGLLLGDSAGGGARHFDGGSQWILGNTSESPLLSGFAAIIVAETGQTTPNGIGIVAGSMSTIPASHSWLLGVTDDGHAIVQVFAGAVPTVLDSSVDLRDGQAHFLAATYDWSTLTVTLIVDDRVVGSATGPVMTLGSGFLAIGGKSPFGGYFFKGTVDEAAHWGSNRPTPKVEDLWNLYQIWRAGN